MNKHDIVNNLVRVNKTLLKIKEINMNSAIDNELVMLISHINYLADGLAPDIASRAWKKQGG
jgi:hypothetical protein